MNNNLPAKEVGGWRRKMRKISVLIGAGAIAVGATLAAPMASAYPGFVLPGSGTCNYPGTGSNSAFGGFCDYPPVLNGSHYHCQWGPRGYGLLDNMGSCDWRDAGNGVVGPPPPEQVMW